MADRNAEEKRTTTTETRRKKKQPKQKRYKLTRGFNYIIYIYTINVNAIESFDAFVVLWAFAAINYLFVCWVRLRLMNGDDDNDADSSKRTNSTSRYSKWMLNKLWGSIHSLLTDAAAANHLIPNIKCTQFKFQLNFNERFYLMFSLTSTHLNWTQFDCLHSHETPILICFTDQTRCCTQYTQQLINFCNQINGTKRCKWMRTRFQSLFDTPMAFSNRNVTLLFSFSFKLNNKINQRILFFAIVTMCQNNYQNCVKMKLTLIRSICPSFV